ncbi:MAG: archease [Phycisphaerae bacterium]|nr:archease [Phycisphaerae bacterium]
MDTKHSMGQVYELFDHTADIGIRARAPTMEGLLRPAAEGLYAVIGELVAGAEAKQMTWKLAGDDAAVLLRDYLAELLVLFEQDRRVVTEPVVKEFTDTLLLVEADAYSIDRDRSAYHREVKAVTYHALEIVEIPGGYQATVIVDI